MNRNVDEPLVAGLTATSSMTSAYSQPHPDLLHGQIAVAVQVTGNTWCTGTSPSQNSDHLSYGSTQVPAIRSTAGLCTWTFIATEGGLLSKNHYTAGRSTWSNKVLDNTSAGFDCTAASRSLVLATSPTPVQVQAPTSDLTNIQHISSLDFT